MAIHLKSADTLSAGFPQLINTLATDAISLIPGLYDQWWVHAGLAKGFSDVSTSVWTGLTNAKQLIGRTGTNNRPLDFLTTLAAADDQPVLRSGWDDDADPDVFDGNNERTQLITTENVFDGGSFSVFVGYIAPAVVAGSRRVFGSDDGTDALYFQLLDTDGRIRYYQRASGAITLQDTTADLRDDAPHILGIGYDATDETLTYRRDGVEIAVATGISSAPIAAKFVLSGYDDVLGQAAEGYFRSLVIVQGTSLMRAKALSNYIGDETDALAAIEQAMMEDVGLTYPV